jgi:hypothetical protein
MTTSYLGSLAGAGILTGVVIGVIGQHYGLGAAEMIASLVVGAALAVVVRCVRAGRTR